MGVPNVTSLQRVFLCLAIVVSSVVAVTPQAAAQDSFGDDSDGYGDYGRTSAFASLEAAGLITTIALGSIALAMTVHDVVSFALDEPFDDGWATVELVLGAGWTALGVFAAVGSLQSGDEFTIAASALGIAFGATNITHAIWSYATNDAPPPVMPVVAPTEGGLTFGVAATL